MISAFTSRYSSWLPHIYFKELRRINHSKVALMDFEPKLYLDWLNRQEPLKAKGKSSGQTTVLKISPHFKIFGKTFYFHRQSPNKRAVPLIVHKQELVYLKAPSGMGKTTLAKIVAGLQKPDFVQFQLADRHFDATTEISVWRKHIWGKKLTMVFQHADEALNLQAEVQDVFKGLPGVRFKNPTELLQVLQEMFDQTLTLAFLKQKTAYLSGGQKQRLNLLRALLLHPDLLILDEPLNGLDFQSIRKVIDIIKKKMAAGSGVLLISHNEEIFDRIIPEKHRYYLAEKESPK